MGVGRSQAVARTFVEPLKHLVEPPDVEFFGEKSLVLKLLGHQVVGVEILIVVARLIQLNRVDLIRASACAVCVGGCVSVVHGGYAVFGCAGACAPGGGWRVAGGVA